MNVDVHTTRRFTLNVTEEECYTLRWALAESARVKPGSIETVQNHNAKVLLKRLEEASHR